MIKFEDSNILKLQLRFKCETKCLDFHNEKKIVKNKTFVVVIAVDVVVVAHVFVVTDPDSISLVTSTEKLFSLIHF
jgi:hypothetical protein